MNMEKEKIRYPLIDLIRFMAILLMVFFHIFYDLYTFRYVKIDFDNNLFWWGLPRVIVTLFLLAVGLSLPLVHLPKLQKEKFIKRFLQIALSASGVSILTFLMFPTRWIYFGTLHCIAVCSVMALPFLNRPTLSIAIAIPLLITSIFFGIDIPWIKLNHLSMDYISPFPWFGVVLIGIFCYHQKWHALLPNLSLPRAVRFAAKHALIIYLLHQPVIYGVIYLFSE